MATLENRSKTGAAAMAIAAITGTVSTAGAGAVNIDGKGSLKTARATGSLNVTTSGAGSVTATGGVAGVVKTNGAGSVTATGGAAGVVKTSGAGSLASTGVVDGIVDTTAAGSVNATAVTGPVAVDTTGAGTVTATGVTRALVVNATRIGTAIDVAGGVNTTTCDTGDGGVNNARGDTGAGGVNNSTGVASAKGSGEDYVKVHWKAAALDCMATAAPLLQRLFGVAAAAHGEKIVLLLASAAEMHARGSNGKRILYASLATLLVGAALHGSTYMLKK